MRSSLLLGLASLAIVGITTFAIAEDKPRAQGKPKNYEVGKTVRYAVWHDGDGWHLRTTTARKQHRFAGHVEIQGGEFVGVQTIKLEKAGKSSDHFKVGEKKHHIAFDFETDEGEDGFDFRATEGAKGIEWDLQVGGGEKKVHADTDLIFIGEDGAHPEKVPFHTYAHPVKEHKR